MIQLTGMSRKNAAAVSLGRKGGRARAQKMTPKERSEAARKAVEVRWAKEKQEIKDLVDDIAERSKAIEKEALRKQKNANA